MSRRVVLLVALAALVFGAGPTVGDIGSCGQAADDLDGPRFFGAQRETTCAHCRACSLTTRACDDACAGRGPVLLPAGCRPIVHDGEVCLRALDAASCDDFSAFVRDAAPTAPSECQFCPVP